jgi:hypothetical protein
MESEMENREEARRETERHQQWMHRRGEYRRRNRPGVNGSGHGHGAAEQQSEEPAERDAGIKHG